MNDHPKRGESPPRLLVAGAGPLPSERPARLHAPGVRIEGIARELARGGHAVRLVTSEPFGPEPGDRPKEPNADASALFVRDLDPGEDPADQLANARVRRIDPPGGRADWTATLAREAEDFTVAAAIGSTDLMNLHLARSGLAVPMWFDFFGDPMAERQMLALAAGSDAGLSDQWEALAPVLVRGDRFSGCSDHQIGAIEGQLATLGRLNRYTATARLVRRIGPWHDPLPAPPASDGEMLLRGKSIPTDAFVILQTGGFNTWLDVETLIAALEVVMEREPRAHFVATGGAIPGHHSAAFERFESAVRASRFRARYHLTGWLPLDHVPRLIAECDLGLNADLPCAEGWLGTRNRLLDWLAGGIAFVTTRGCELAEELEALGAARVVPQRDPDALAAAVMQLLADHAARTRMRNAGHAALNARYRAAARLEPLLDWARAPLASPDRLAWIEAPDTRPALALGSGGRAASAARIEELRREKTRIENRLRSLKGSRLVRLAGALSLRQRNTPPPRQPALPSRDSSIADPDLTRPADD